MFRRQIFMKKAKGKELKKQLFDPEYIQNVLDEKNITGSIEAEEFHWKGKLKER